MLQLNRQVPRIIIKYIYLFIPGPLACLREIFQTPGGSGTFLVVWLYVDFLHNHLNIRCGPIFRKKSWTCMNTTSIYLLNLYSRVRIPIY